jgi:outer membrane lipoprotein-sorting protein
MVSFRTNLGVLGRVCLLLAALTHVSVLRADDLLNAWLDRQATIKTWSAELVQTRTLKSFTQPLTTPGHLWFVAPETFRWELGNPAQTIALRQTNQLLVLYPKLKRAEKYALNAGAGGRKSEWNDALGLLQAGFPRTRAEMQLQFNIKSVEVKAGMVLVTLQPKSSARKMIPRIAIEFDEKTLDLHATEMEFADGSTMRNDFSNAKLNEPIPDATFNPDLEGLKVVEPTKSKQ